MPRCASCNSTILFGGPRDGELRFCNDECRAQGALLRISQHIPDGVVQELLWKVHRGPCPRCGGSGPVDVHASHHVWSALFLTSWHSEAHVCCRRCGIKVQLGGAATSMVLGWWGLPFGLIATPIQIIRNFVSMIWAPDPGQPSVALARIVRLDLAAQAVAADPNQGPP